MHIEVVEKGDRVEIVLTGPLDSGGAATLKDLGREYLEKETRVLVIDCAKVTFISSSGVGSLLVLQDEFEDHGKLACFRSPSPEVRSVIRLMDLECILNLVLQEDEIQTLMATDPGAASMEPRS